MSLKDYTNKKTLGLSTVLIIGNIILAGSKLVPVRFAYLGPVLSLVAQLLLSMASRSRSGMTVKQLRLMTKVYRSKGIPQLEPYVRNLTGKELVDLSRVEASRVLDDLLSMSKVKARKEELAQNIHERVLQDLGAREVIIPEDALLKDLTPVHSTGYRKGEPRIEGEFDLSPVKKNDTNTAGT